MIRRFFFVVVAFALLAPFGAAAQQLRLPAFDELERSLRLTPYQKEQFEVASAATQRAMISIALGVVQVKSRLTQELLKDRPDPDAVMQAQQEMIDFAKPHVRAAREEWMRLYATLDDEQVRIARTFVEEKLRLLEKVAEHLGRTLAEKIK